MTMVYLANVRSHEDCFGIQFTTPDACITLDYPCEGNPNHYVLSHWGPGRSGEFNDLASALDAIAFWLKSAEPY